MNGAWIRTTVFGTGLLLWSAAMSGDLTFEQRVEAQSAIERVYWSHRVWPSENPEPKPAFESAVPISAVRAKVEDYLRKSRVLAELWNHTLTPAELQAEVD